MPEPSFVPLAFEALSDDDVLARADTFRACMVRRRTVREFSDRPVDRAVIEACLEVAGSAPSGANLQPWQFVVVSDAALKHRIRLGAEAEEREFYAHRAPQQWLDALAPLGTNANKDFLETAPYLIAVFQQRYSRSASGERIKHYYAGESVGIAAGLLIAALHQAGLATLTHTPSPMGFLNRILQRPASERPFLLLVLGHPAEGARVPDIRRKRLEQIATFL